MTSSFGKKLQQLRKEKKWTQDELGRRTGIHGRSIGAYEAGMNFPSRNTLQKLADVFEVPVEYFLIDDENSLAGVPIRDKELLRYFIEVDKMDDEAKKVVKTVIEGLMARGKGKE
jgi:transcriptional regulator with XRE-family HTH domain